MFHKPVLFKPANAGQKQLWTSKVSLLLLFVCHSCNSVTARSSQFFFSHVFSNHDLCLRIDFGCKLFKSSIIIGLKDYCIQTDNRLRLVEYNWETDELRRSLLSSTSVPTFWFELRY